MKIMMDHDIFISNNEFRQMFTIEGTLENILKVYSSLGIDYGIAHDIPTRLHLQGAVELA